LAVKSPRAKHERERNRNHIVTQPSQLGFIAAIKFRASQICFAAADSELHGNCCRQELFIAVIFPQQDTSGK
jgi:hypothetical protein